MLRKVCGLSFLLMLSGVIFSSDHGAEIYNNCIGCHGEQGEGNVAVGAPSLAGQSSNYIQRQLTNFRSGLRGAVEGDSSGAQMSVIAKSLADDQAIADVAVYLSGLPSVKHESTVKGDIKAGRSVYNGSCSDCHGAAAEGFERLSSPKLSGLDSSYLIAQFNKFKLSQRGYHKDDKFGRQMKFMAEEISTDEKLNNVVAYIQSLSK